MQPTSTTIEPPDECLDLGVATYTPAPSLRSLGGPASLLSRPVGPPVLVLLSVLVLLAASSVLVLPYRTYTVSTPALHLKCHLLSA